MYIAYIITYIQHLYNIYAYTEDAEQENRKVLSSTEWQSFTATHETVSCVFVDCPITFVCARTFQAEIHRR